MTAPTSLELLKLFLREKSDPAPFHQALADRSTSQIPFRLRGARVLDLGSGPGWYSRALEREGASVVSIDLEMDNISNAGTRPTIPALADGLALPFAPGSFDGIFCCNVLEHTPDPEQVLDEMARVLHPGGWAWVAWTPWWSPWGGHNIVPLHLLGPRLGPRVWRALFGDPPKNVPGKSLFPTYVGTMLDSVLRREDLALVDARPRYYPSQRWVLRVRGLRELATWNCLMLLLKPKHDPVLSRPPPARGGLAPGATGDLAQPSTWRLARWKGRRFMRWGKYLIGDDPVFLPVLTRLTPEGTSKSIRSSTEIVIEGFPRSGNTFAVFALRDASGGTIEVASHVHHPAQVKEAVRRGLPVLLVVREPLATLASYLIAAPHGTPAGVLREYIRYHAELLPLREQIEVATFEEVTRDFAEVTKRLNDRYGTSFSLFEHDEANLNAIFDAIERYHAAVHPRKEVERVVPRPSSERAAEREALIERLCAPEHRQLLRRAEALYEVFSAR